MNLWASRRWMDKRASRPLTERNATGNVTASPRSEASPVKKVGPKEAQRRLLARKSVDRDTTPSPAISLPNEPLAAALADVTPADILARIREKATARQRAFRERRRTAKEGE